MSSFWENELYVTRFGEVINDEVETILFQEIDNYGADAVRAFVDGDERAMHYQLQALLSYLGAQKLRTPKGLAWIQARYPALSQVEILTELQHLRHMFGALWGESVREIVSAESSEVKFLVTDHPVTMFNAALPVDAPQFADHMDPPLTWNGTSPRLSPTGSTPRRRDDPNQARSRSCFIRLVTGCGAMAAKRISATRTAAMATVTSTAERREITRLWKSNHLLSYPGLTRLAPAAPATRTDRVANPNRFGSALRGTSLA